VQRNLQWLGLGSWGWAFVQSGTAIAHIPSTKEVQVYDVESGRVSRHEVKSGDARGITANRSGDTLYLSVNVPDFRPESEIRVVHAADMAPLSSLGRVGDFLGKLCLSADETTIAAACGDWNASFRGEHLCFRVWNIANGKRPIRARTLIYPRNPVNAFALSADGSLLALAESAALTVWNTHTSDEVFFSGKHRRKVTAVACSPTKPLIATGDSAGGIFLWEHSGNVLTRYAFGLGEIYGLAFAPDGLRCAAVDGTGKVVVWDMDV
jgi:WD40 repeat protein